jgi:hypothetical protein
MKSSIILVLILTLFFKPSFPQEEKVLSFSLEDCIVKALKDNLTVAVEVYNPDLADASLAKAKEFFLPRFTLFLWFSKYPREETSPWV